MLILFIDSTMANIKLNSKSEIYMKPDAFSDSEHFLPLRRDLLKKKTTQEMQASHSLVDHRAQKYNEALRTRWL